MFDLPKLGHVVIIMCGLTRIYIKYNVRVLVSNVVACPYGRRGPS
jgi:hypothetical protein